MLEAFEGLVHRRGTLIVLLRLQTARIGREGLAVLQGCCHCSIFRGVQREKVASSTVGPGSAHPHPAPVLRMRTGPLQTGSPFSGRIGFFCPTLRLPQEDPAVARVGGLGGLGGQSAGPAHIPPPAPPGQGLSQHHALGQARLSPARLTAKDRGPVCRQEGLQQPGRGGQGWSVHGPERDGREGPSFPRLAGGFPWVLPCVTQKGPLWVGESHSLGSSSACPP